jgi:hypothetical protein
MVKCILRLEPDDGPGSPPSDPSIPCLVQRWHAYSDVSIVRFGSLGRGYNGHSIDGGMVVAEGMEYMGLRGG